MHVANQQTRGSTAKKVLDSAALDLVVLVHIQCGSKSQIISKGAITCTCAKARTPLHEIETDTLKYKILKKIGYFITNLNYKIAKYNF
jgi:hypothetical protein